MLRRIRRQLPLVAALTVVAGLVSLAAAFSPFADFHLVCPPQVMAGTPIDGYCAGGAIPMTVTAMDGNGVPLPGSPHSMPTDPLMFSFPTFEPMMGTVVTINAGDAIGRSLSAFVVIQ